MEGFRLLLFLVLVLGVVRGGGGRSSRPQKWRQRLKALLYEYKTGGQEEEEASRQANSRQCGGSTGIVCCDNSANDGLACLTNITQMFNNIKTVMEFRIKQLDNFDEKFKRLGRVLKLLNSKSSKNSTFNNATLLLAKALGGDMKNPTCEGMEGEKTRSLPQSISTYNTLNSCPANVLENCSVPLNLVNQTMMQLWQDCNNTSTQLVDKTMECQKNEDDEEKCNCWKASMELVENFKESNCLQSITQPMVKLNQDVKKSCLSTYQDCKTKEDDALFMINACDHQETVIIGNSRASRTQDEDWEADQDEPW